MIEPPPIVCRVVNAGGVYVPEVTINGVVYSAQSFRHYRDADIRNEAALDGLTAYELHVEDTCARTTNKEAAQLRATLRATALTYTFTVLILMAIIVLMAVQHAS